MRKFTQEDVDFVISDFKTMTQQQFLDKYGDVEVTFSHYYKFTFTYAATLPDGSRLTVGVGGNSDDIYRFEVSNNEVATVCNLNPYQGSVYCDNREVEGFYEY
jgi:hypothetical protein